MFEQAGYIHLLDPKTGKEHVVNITATGDFPWMMPQWKDVTASMSNLALSPTGKRVAVEARGEIFTIPAERATSATSRNSSASAEHEPAWSPDGKMLSYFSDRSGEYALYIESQDGLTPPREIKIPTTGHFYTAAWSPDGKRIMFHDTESQAVGRGRRDRAGEGRRQRSVDGADAHDESGVVAGRQVDRLREASEFALQGDRGRERRDGRVEAGDRRSRRRQYRRRGTRAASICGSSRRPTSALKSQWLDMSNYDHTETFGLYAAMLRKTRSVAVPAGER